MLITSRTPLRVSFFGGGTDYPEYYARHPGAVLGMAIDKHIYISAMRLEKFIGYNYRLSYRIIEEVDALEHVKHPVFRAVMEMHDMTPGWNFGVMSSLPSRSGLGSSSSFTVGLLNLIGAMKGTRYTRHELGTLACHVERDILKENVGIQDQFHAAYGGLNRYDFSASEFSIRPVRVRSAVREIMNSSMYLVHTGIARYASEVVADQIGKTREKTIDRELSHLYKLVDEGRSVLEGDNPEKVISECGRLLHESWMTKRGLSPHVSSKDVDDLYSLCMSNGALGGKLCGAGGGGFLFIMVRADDAPRLQSVLGERSLIPIRIDESGSTLLQS